MMLVCDPPVSRNLAQTDCEPKIQRFALAFIVDVHAMPNSSSKRYVNPCGDFDIRKVKFHRFF